MTAERQWLIIAGMNVLALQASPRSDGNTATLARAFVEGLEAAGVHRVREVFLDGLDIRACTACEACLAEGLEGERFCVFEDDMQPLYRQFIDADLVVLASPIYWWSISAQLKVFIDRLYGLNFGGHPERYRGKKLVLVFTHQEAHPCSGAEIARKMFDEIAGYTHMSIVGDLRYSSEARHVREDSAKMREARELGLRLARAGSR